MKKKNNIQAKHVYKNKKVVSKSLLKSTYFGKTMWQNIDFF